jgi:hypothetical protein
MSVKLSRYKISPPLWGFYWLLKPKNGVPLQTKVGFSMCLGATQWALSFRGLRLRDLEREIEELQSRLIKEMTANKMLRTELEFAFATIPHDEGLLRMRIRELLAFTNASLEKQP